MEKKTMKALVYHGPNQFSLDDVPVPRILKPTDAIGRVTLSAICTSDVHIVHGDIKNVITPKILGHEFCVEIVEIGSAVTGLQPGDRAHVLPGTFCGECAYCKMGVNILCKNDDSGCFGANGPDGCQAEYIRIPLASDFCIKIPEGLKEEDVILLGDMLATAWFGVKNARVREGQSVAVIGVGPVGLCACLLAKKVFGAKQVIAIDILQYRVELALTEGIADVGINPHTEDLRSKIMQATGGGVDAIIETVGISETLNMAFAFTKPGGIVSTVAIFAEPVELPMQEIVYKNLEFRSGIQSCEGVAEMLQMIQDGKISTKFMQTHRAPLNAISKGYDIFGNKKEGCVKWLVTPYEE
ncbi:theronine dehydrogenase [Desulfosporosinus fructosivorans]|uniref:Theronine dehydrogenase n=1 Tax=Desulfosporosinus fructosivorans TaxID=2018669 RepID=A0A4Z0R4T4_9FIRM|nr:zinc-binding dehydrogenase [Desulfosporosinus fructosivorans]TGE37017.1 theronine dehydrogenase [Desulfosporosinus fructosivorans]